jgi:hypothetical protein
VTPDYGGRGKVWTFGDLEPKTGLATIQATTERTTKEFLTFLDHVDATWSTGNLIVILDNLSVHKTLFKEVRQV